jgi:hypothetical protein
VSAQGLRLDEFEGELAALEERVAALEALEARVQRLRSVMGLFADLHERLVQARTDGRARAGPSPLFAVQTELEAAAEALRLDTREAARSLTGGAPGTDAYAWRASVMVAGAARSCREPELRGELVAIQGRLDEIAEGL